MTTHPTLTLEELLAAVAGGAVALRQRATLQPAGGPGDKVFPPTYATGDNADTRYCYEDRVIDGHRVPCVLLDSVASQANRIEVALREAWEAKEADFPVIGVDFSHDADVSDLGLLTTLDAPHRIADALLRDAVADIDGKAVRFRDTPIGQAYTAARVTSASALYLSCPTALVLGVWDSTGPRGGLGAKFPRALVSEVVGVQVARGKKTASRLDPAGIQITAGPLYALASDPSDWTTNEAEAAVETAANKKGAKIQFSRGEKKTAGKPSAANHGNIAPSIEEKAGGVTIDHARQVSVLSLIALRRLRFPTDAAGARFAPEAVRPAELAARTALAALALAGQALLREQGLDLRSRCLLVETGDTTLELLDREGGAARPFSLTGAQALDLLRAAATEAAAHGLPWQRAPLTLRPAPKVVALIRKSRELGAPAEGEAV